MLSSTCLYIAYSFCSALHRVQIWKAVFRRYCDSGLKWCWSTVSENNERFPLTSASFSLGLQGRELRHETTLIHPNALTQIAVADSSVMESRICTSECHLLQTCFTVCKYTEGNRCAREQQNLARLPRWSAEGGSHGPRGCEIQREPCPEAGCCWAAARCHHTSLGGSFSQVLLVCAAPDLGRGEAWSSFSCAAPALITALFVTLKQNWINSFENWKIAFQSDVNSWRAECLHKHM